MRRAAQQVDSLDSDQARLQQYSGRPHESAGKAAAYLPLSRYWKPGGAVHVLSPVTLL
jgi:hypothetical protein